MGVEIGAHHGFGLFELSIEPGRHVREVARRGREQVIAANERFRETARDPLVPFPDIAAQDDQVLRRETAGAPEVFALDRPDVGKKPDDRPVDRVITRGRGGL